MTDKEKELKLLKAKIAVALQDEYQRVPTEQGNRVGFSLNPGDVQSSLGLHYRREEQKKAGQLTIF
jgi:hypothetical protein